ncbi:uncharacterized protein LOC127424265 isoform X2 [Myxocyprinus asiaticus]|uniref:uncharacterized protein LOC127424265 isoform X2 n=1 Tax=Myxocyprinus asiaticus TaxID=70543 RepID=UPI0022215A0E|nr:uncharacterized protein LOC127424265 isoform X2 [Myxocyprinus asiaticus]
MSIFFLVFTLSVVVAEDKPLLITADCRDHIILPCAAFKNSQSYTSVTWYKIYNKTCSSILIQEKSVGTRTKYNNSVSLGKNASLILRKVAPANAGTYKCFLRAKVGGINNHSLLTLNISGINCFDSVIVSLDCMSAVSPTFDFFTKFINGSSENISMTYVSMDAGLSTLWASVGLALSKVLLSAVCIWVFKELRELRKRRQT